LIEFLTDALPKVKVENGKYLDRLTSFLFLYEADRIIPEGTIQELLIDFLDELPVRRFVSDSLTKELSERAAYSSDAPPKELNKIEGFENEAELARALVERLESLPWKYTLSFEFSAEISSVFNTFIDELPLSPEMRVIASSEKLAEHFPLDIENENHRNRVLGQGGLLSLVGSQKPDWQEGRSYLQIETEGFIGPYGGSNTVVNTYRKLKAFFGLGIALRLFDVEIKYNPNPLRSYANVHKMDDTSWRMDERLQLFDDDSRAISWVRLHSLGAKLDSDEKKIAWSRRQLKEMSVVFSNEAKAENIILASQWLFNSYTGLDELLNYVQAMVVLEILLGEGSSTSELSLGELLRSRCAYLIGNSHDERTDLLRDFKKIYDVRSQIVHRGKHRLSGEERVLLNKLKWMCRRVIYEEVRLLKSDKDA